MASILLSGVILIARTPADFYKLMEEPHVSQNKDYLEPNS
jgi:hypothetical protein